MHLIYLLFPSTLHATVEGSGQQGVMSECRDKLIHSLDQNLTNLQIFFT